MKNKYRVNTDEEEIVFWVKQHPVSVIENQPDESIYGIDKESITILSPNWMQIAHWHTLASGGGMLPFASDKELDKLLIKHCLRRTSFFDLDIQPDEEDKPCVANIDEFLETVHPTLIDYIVLCIRRRM